MYKKILKKFSEFNPEKFNKDFILSKSDKEILPEITKIFKSLEIIEGVKVNSVTLNSDEETYGPIKQKGFYYKSPLESRLLKIHYNISINDTVVSQDIFLPKMLNNCFYINESVRFFPIWQIVGNFVYSVKNGITLKTLMIPVTLLSNDYISYNPEFSTETIEKIPLFLLYLFKKKVSPLLFIMLENSLKSLSNAGISPFEDFSKFQEYEDENLITEFNKLVGFDIKFSDNALDLKEEGRTVFTVRNQNTTGLSFSMKDEDIKTQRGLVVLGLLLNTNGKEKKLKLAFNLKQFKTPWYWIDELISASGYSKSPDPFKRYEKARSLSLSLSRIIDNQIKSMLPIESKHKDNILSLFLYLMENYKDLYNQNTQDLHYKRVRLYEYILFPLRVYLGNHINRIINQQTAVDTKSIEKIFTSLTPMFLLKNLITSQLLRTYNSSNDFNLFSAYLKGTFKGPQALGKGVSFSQRDIDPSYVGRIDLVAASPSDPGVSFTFTPFVRLYNGFFDKKEEEKTKL